VNAFVESRIQMREQQLARVSRQIRDLQRNKAEIEAEIRAYKDVLANLLGTPPETVVQKSDIEQRLESLRTGTTRISEGWRQILTKIGARHPNPTDIDDIRSIAKSVGHELSDETIRSQLSVYTARGWLERVSTGNYRLTAEGASAVGATLGNADVMSIDDLLD
jgi:hypothetical protein